MPGREAEETCTLGMGIIERLGGRTGMPVTDWVGDRARDGENARCMYDVGLTSPAADIERKWLFDGAGMWLGVFGRVRGETAVDDIAEGSPGV